MFAIHMQAADAPDYKVLYEQSQLEMLQLKQQLAQLQKMIFGSRQERFVSAGTDHPQLSLGIHAESIATGTVVNSQKIAYIKNTIAVEQNPLVYSCHDDPVFLSVDPPAKQVVKVRA